MTQTYGSQIFGSMYDVVGWVVAIGIFVYFGLGAQGMTIEQRARVPRWLFNKKICFGLAALSAVFAIGTFTHWL
ncbi:hypothetical protein [Burkholderia ubonensis]|uniref:hypothetical protein n=1 Tax=Burkholderia ubonensis TaxID=101571 RepID=UPI00075BFE9E|nr:hypothetical protein [Burkholderia ubonensis]KWB61670.1 hypothetical protein WL39_20535 [Burkholderia ubonensis]KWB68071.1 hypothetical protein WL38_14280 [Burkholderia ubonensis]